VMDRPAQHLIDAQQEALAQEIAKRPLVGFREPISTLVDEYSSATAVFQSKVAYLARTYSGIHRIRGDGNCFVRGAAVFGLLNALRTIPAVRATVLSVLRGSCARALVQGYSEFVIEDFYDAFMEEVERCVCENPVQTEEELITRLNDEETSEYCVMFMRFFISTILLENAETYLSFIPEATSMRAYVRAEIEPMKRESEELSLIAFSHVGVAFAVEYLDQSGSNDSTNSHVFRPPGAPETDPVAFTLLFRPGHFDILV
jgi:hypothetical protein